MNRETMILRQLETALTATPEGLADRLDLGRRSIANSVAKLNDLLASAASIRLEHGRYRLYIVDAHRYGEIRDHLMAADESLNDPARRHALIYCELLRSPGPVRIEDLAGTLSVSRSTVAADLASVRETLSAHDVTITGRPNEGLRLSGAELNLRMAGLTHYADVACDEYPLGDEITELINTISTSKHLNTISRRTVRRWLTITLDRYLSGHPINSLPPEFAQLSGTAAHDFAITLLDAVSPLVRSGFPRDEQLFMTMAVAGMRTPDDLTGRQLFPAAEDIPQLADAVFERIAQVMGIRLDTEQLADEFCHHLSFMLNRMRFRIRMDDTAVADIRGQYPVAYRMAEISRDVIEDRTGLQISDPEVSLMAGYHQVFLDTYQSRLRTHLRVVIVTAAGRVSGHLLRIQLSKALPDGTKYAMMSADQLDPVALEAADLIVATPGAMDGSDIDVSAPAIELGAVFDPDELMSQLSLIRLSRHADLPLRGLGSSFLASMLDADRFLALAPGTSYRQATEALVDRLEELGLVGRAFREALQLRERDASMLLDDQVGFPHATLPGADRIVFAMAVVPHADGAPGVKAVFLMGVPDKQDYDDTILIDVYDEIIRLASDSDRLTSLSRITSHEQLFWFMANHPSHRNH
ncbi:BglG family transcription antiterminator [Acidipropionibacterium virtanenii]|uniref:Transcriptional regulator ManR n=1 Tax=Acidipropionibacterium virtanenii TaxID=2057246 RepID=A0A344UT94_9ACTN|nr:PRD domain-containing protein [Acidipropionibacterium virtanenii]AXE38492.1 Transcriptional regulator ManR [Acidipropionibacterium virtanenii]